MMSKVIQTLYILKVFTLKLATKSKLPKIVDMICKGSLISEGISKFSKQFAKSPSLNFSHLEIYAKKLRVCRTKFLSRS